MDETGRPSLEDTGTPKDETVDAVIEQPTPEELRERLDWLKRSIVSLDTETEDGWYQGAMRQLIFAKEYRLSMDVFKLFIPWCIKDVERLAQINNEDPLYVSMAWSHEVKHITTDILFLLDGAGTTLDTPENSYYIEIGKALLKIEALACQAGGSPNDYVNASNRFEYSDPEKFGELQDIINDPAPAEEKYKKRFDAQEFAQAIDNWRTLTNDYDPGVTLNGVKEGVRARFFEIRDEAAKSEEG